MLAILLGMPVITSCVITIWLAVKMIILYTISYCLPDHDPFNYIEPLPSCFPLNVSIPGAVLGYSGRGAKASSGCLK